jgi:hypothetical protein
MHHVEQFPLRELKTCGERFEIPAKCKTAKARAAYQDFLTPWKAADPDIPIFIAAKAEYAKLQ